MQHREESTPCIHTKAVVLRPIEPAPQRFSTDRFAGINKVGRWENVRKMSKTKESFFTLFSVRFGRTAFNKFSWRMRIKLYARTGDVLMQIYSFFEKWNSPDDSKRSIADWPVGLHILGDVGRLVVWCGSSCCGQTLMTAIKRSFEWTHRELYQRLKHRRHLLEQATWRHS